MATQSCLISELRGLKNEDTGNATVWGEDSQRVKHSFLKKIENLDYTCKTICGGVDVHIVPPESSSTSTVTAVGQRG